MNVDEKRGKVKRREEVPKWSTGEKNTMKPTEKVKKGDSKRAMMCLSQRPSKERFARVNRARCFEKVKEDEHLESILGFAIWSHS